MSASKVNRVVHVEVDMVVEDETEARHLVQQYDCDVVKFVPDGPGGGCPVVTIEGKRANVIAYLVDNDYEVELATFTWA